MKKQLYFVIFAISSLICTALEPFSTSAIFGSVVVAGGVYKFWDESVKCQFTECCSSPHWVIHNVTRFQDYFDTFVFGQHLVRDIVSKALKTHMKKAQPKKALVLSFHGWTGTGKNFVASFVAQSLFRKGLKSDFARVFISTVHFPNPQKVDIYKIELQNTIMNTVKACSQALFVFDEIDKMPEGLIDAVKPFIDYHDEVQGIDFRRSIFLFLSNTGGEEINKIAINAYFEGRLRESITYTECELLIKNGAFNEIGGLHRSSVIDKHLVDWYVPFLPLERKHVASCVVAEAHQRNSTIVLKKDEIDVILNELIYFPKDVQVYSATGCKTVSPKVDILLHDILEEEYT